MALLAEELVEEWLNRDGFFTIRGAKLGVHEIDLLAVRLTGSMPECRHVEVQASVNPVSWLTPLSKKWRRETGRAPQSQAGRSDAVLEESVAEWVEKKFFLPRKVALREELVPGVQWQLELVVNRVLHEEELLLIERAGIRVTRLAVVIEAFREEGLVPKASGGDFVELVTLGSSIADA